MTSRKRKIYFIAAIFIFIAATPLLILYSSGYRFDFQSFTVAKTGGIFISSYPKGVDIYINDKLSKTTGSNIFSQGGLVDGLKPGEYTVAIKKNDYKDWVKKMTVNASLVTEARNIFLVPNALKDETISEGVNDFILSDSNSIIAYAAKNTVNVLQIPSKKNDQFTFDLKERIGRISFLGEEYLLIENLYQNKLKKYIYDIATKESAPLKESANEKYVKIERLPGDQLKLAALSDQNILYAIDAHSQNEQEIIAKDVGNFEIFGSAMIYTTIAPIIAYEKDLPSGNTRQLIKSPINNISMVSTILRSKDGNRAIIDNKQRLLIYNGETESFNFVSSDIAGAKFSPDGKKIMYRNSKEIFVYYLKDVRIQPYRNRGDIEFITRFSKPIADCEWYNYDNEHIIFTADKFIKFTELDGRNQRNTYDIAEARNALKIKYNSYDDYLYFLDGTALKRLTLIAQ